MWNVQVINPTDLHVKNFPEKEERNWPHHPHREWGLPRERIGLVVFKPANMCGLPTRFRAVLCNREYEGKTKTEVLPWMGCH